jgi:OFA family oxalate/formate antiporter-like MFS transporter
VDDLMVATGGSRAEMAVALTLSLFSLSLFGIVSGWIVDRFGPRRLMYGGGLLTTLAWVLTAFADSLTMLYLSFGLCLGAGVGLIYNPAINTCLRWFPDKRGFVSGFLLSASPLGTLAIAKLAAVLCHAFGSAGLLWIGLIYLALTFSVGWKMVLPQSGWRPDCWKPASTPEKDRAGGDFSCVAMIRTAAFWHMLLLYALAATAGAMMVSVLSPIAQVQLGMEPVIAANMVVANCLANFFGRLAAGRLCDKWGEAKTLILIFVLTVIGLLGMRQAASVIAFTAFLLLLGGSYGGVLVVFPPLCARMFGIAHSGANYGILFFGHAFGGLIGPQIAARTVDKSLGVHAFDNAYLLAAAVAVMGLALSLAFVRRRAPVDSGREL